MTHAQLEQHWKSDVSVKAISNALIADVQSAKSRCEFIMQLSTGQDKSLKGHCQSSGQQNPSFSEGAFPQNPGSSQLNFS